MLDLFVRRVYHLDLHVTAAPKEAPHIQLSEVLAQISKAAAAKEAVYLFAEDTAAIRIVDAKMVGPSSVAMLFQYANSNAADPVFASLQTGELRTEPKLLGEGVAVSAHCLFHLQPDAKFTDVYRVVLEAVPGLSRTLVQRTLRAVAREVANYNFTDSNGKQRSARPMLDLVGRLSESFLEDLEKGRLSSIELLRFHDTSDLFDEDSETDVKCASLKVEPRESARGSKGVEFLKSVLAKGKERRWTHVRVKYFDEGDNQKTPEFEIDKAEAVDTLIAKTTTMTLADPLLQCEPLIRDDVVLKLQTAMQQDAPTE